MPSVVGRGQRGQGGATTTWPRLCTICDCGALRDVRACAAPDSASRSKWSTDTELQIGQSGRRGTRKWIGHVHNEDTTSKAAAGGQRSLFYETLRALLGEWS